MPLLLLMSFCPLVFVGFSGPLSEMVKGIVFRASYALAGPTDFTQTWAPSPLAGRGRSFSRAGRKIKATGKTRIARYIPVRQLTGTWIGRYRAVALGSAVDGRFPSFMVDFRRLRLI
ncbi:hypothetical protein BHM03_00030880 [Ensete ventricosum]|nr:hypothetical protein BHM03_00030880 [Ensete ventricosum]